MCLSQEFAEQSYDAELQALQETIQHKVVTLLSDTDNSVKMTLIDNDIGRLCHFFGRQKGECTCCMAVCVIVCLDDQVQMCVSLGMHICLRVCVCVFERTCACMCVC